MFQGLLKRAERSLDQVIARAIERALVVVPLLVAAGFATAALTVKLVELYGAALAYAVMAALFAVIGLVIMAIVNTGTAEPEADASPAAASDDSAQSDGSADDTADVFPPELRSVLASVAPAALPGVLRGVGRNLPLVVILAIVAFVISRFAASTPPEPGSSEEAADEDESDTEPAEPVARAAAA
jgi:Na+-transporting methylmalonyl-CoA/oxaloacetate decarboxylase gamma subunit